jgi:pyruvate formate lyase activating enzyme
MPDGLSRRDFIRVAAGAGLGALALSQVAAARTFPVSDHEALAYEKLADKQVVCLLCPRECSVADGKRGYCEVRENQGGVYKSLVYGRVCTAHVDPIEKKPFFHFLPGTMAYSLATAGCNLDCQFCQNWEISQARPEDIESEYVPPAEVVARARRYECRSIAFTYSEPTVFYEYMLDTARAGKEAGIPGVSVTNGFIQAEPMKRLCEVLGAVKVDLKGFTEEFYRRYTLSRLKPVLDTIELVKAQGMHLELVTLLIPTLNDSEAEVRELSRWVVKNLGPDVPMHFTRFYPLYKMTNLPATPAATLDRAREIAASEGVHYAYVGNLPGDKYESTYCHSCGKMIVERYSVSVQAVHVKDGKCEYCGTAIPGVWK